MNPLINNKGIALVTSLMFTLISLTIVMYMMYMITSGVKQSGASKRYKTVLEATYGGTDLLIKDILPTIFTKTIAEGLSNPGNHNTGDALIGMYNSSLNLATSSNACLMQKLTLPSSQWTACTNGNYPDASRSPDFTVKLNSTSSEPFTVYTKIVETICSDPRPYPTGKCTGSDLTGIDYLDGGGGTTAGGSGGISVQPMPAVYRIEVKGERTNNPLEKSVLSVLYAF